MIPDRLSSPEAAKYLGLSEVTIKTWRRRGTGPAWLKLGRRVLYDRHDLDEFMVMRRHGGDSEVAAK